MEDKVWKNKWFGYEIWIDKKKKNWIKVNKWRSWCQPNLKIIHDQNFIIIFLNLGGEQIKAEEWISINEKNLK